MSLQPGPVPPVPPETARLARAAFPEGTPLVRMRDALGAIYDDEAFAHRFPTRGQPAEAPWRLALVTILQFAEDLSDRQRELLEELASSMGTPTLPRKNKGFFERIRDAMAG